MMDIFFFIHLCSLLVSQSGSLVSQCSQRQPIVTHMKGCFDVVAVVELNMNICMNISRLPD